MTNKAPQCCGEIIKVAKNADGSFSYTCPKCGRSTSGKNPAEASTAWFGDDTTATQSPAPAKGKPAVAEPATIADLPSSSNALTTWAQTNMLALLKSSAAWLDTQNTEKPATRRMIEKNIDYVLNNNNIAKAWDTEEGKRSIVNALKDSFYYGATMPEMGCIIPFGAVVEFVPDVEAFRFALTTGDNAPFASLTIEIIHETDKYKCGRKDGDFFIEFENIQAKRGEVIGVAVYGLNRVTGKVDGEMYDVERLMSKAESHSSAYQYYLADLNLAKEKQVQGETAKEGDREYFIKTMKGKGGKPDWDKKIYLDEIRNPYIGADRPEMLRKLAGKTFCRPYMKVRNAAELASEWNEEAGENPSPDDRKQAADKSLSRAGSQFPDAKDAEIVGEGAE